MRTVRSPCVWSFQTFFFFFPATPRTDVVNWQLIGWMKDDFQLDNPKRADDYITLITPTAGETFLLNVKSHHFLTVFKVDVFKDGSQYGGSQSSAPCQSPQRHVWDQGNTHSTCQSAPVHINWWRAPCGFHFSVTCLVFNMLGFFNLTLFKFNFM